LKEEVLDSTLWRASQSTYFPAWDKYNIYTYTRYAAVSPVTITK